MRTDNKGKLDPAVVGSPYGLEMDLLRFSSNLYHYVVKAPEDFRFLRVVQKEPHSYLAIIGGYDHDGTPTVAFGNGHSFAAALHSLGSSLSAGNWHGDKYAK